MEMTREEIVSSYRQAKDKKNQLGVLADLNCATREQIKKELMAGGGMHQELPRAPRRTQAEIDTDLIAKTKQPVIEQLKDLAKEGALHVPQASTKPQPVRVFRDTLLIPEAVEKILKERVSYIESDIQVIDSNIKRMEDRQIALQNEAIEIKQFLGLPKLG